MPAGTKGHAIQSDPTKKNNAALNKLNRGHDKKAQNTQFTTPWCVQSSEGKHSKITDPNNSNAPHNQQHKNDLLQKC